MPSVRPPPRRRLRWAIGARALGLAACMGRTIHLGDKAPRPYHFDTPQLVAELASNARTDNPTLTADLLEIYFTRTATPATATSGSPAQRPERCRSTRRRPSRRSTPLVRDQLGDLGRRPDALVRLGSQRRRRKHRHLEVEPAEPIRVLVDAGQRGRAEHARRGHPAAARPARPGHAAVVEAGDVGDLPDVPGDAARARAPRSASRCSSPSWRSRTAAPSTVF